MVRFLVAQSEGTEADNRHVDIVYAVTRRESVGVLGAAAMAAAAKYPDAVVSRHDQAVDYYLKNQVTDPASRWRGALPDAYGLYAPGTAVGIWEVFTAAYLTPESKHFRSKELLSRIQLAAGFVDRELSPDGNIYLPVTNFNSPPDTAFAVRSAATTSLIARQAKAPEILKIVDPLIERMTQALLKGGIHTPNHRWVLSAALAQANELWPNPAFVRRIDQWLAEGLDIDPDGQWSERSTVTYNPISDNALVTIADKLKRPDLLEPVRRNLDAMLYLIHPGGEVETGFSRRQDLNTRGTMAGYWFSLQYFAAKLGEKRFGLLARELFPTSAGLSALIAYPELNRTDFATEALPDNFVKEFPHNDVVRIKRGDTSITISGGERDRFLSVRRGPAVINAVRFATAFFGKAQFRPSQMKRDGEAWVLTQDLDGPYYQPFTPTRKIGADEWDQTQKQRPRTEVCQLRQQAIIQEIPNGLRLRVVAAGTANVPLAIEINLREGGKTEGIDGHLVTSKEARYTLDGQSIRIAGGGCEHRYTDVRGALPKLPGPSVYITGLTPFDRTIDFTWG
jgi:hypothetical protein